MNKANDVRRAIELVDIDTLRELIKKLELGDPQRNAHVEARWLNYVDWWDSRASKAKWRYHGLRTTVVIGGALIPALVGLREMADLAPYATWFAVASIVVSLLIAVCAGLDSLYGYGDIWREKRLAAELIKSEGFSFFDLTGKYESFPTHAEAYKAFAANVEDLILKEIKEYIVAVSPKRDQNKDDG